jgi:SH3 domain protein
MKKIIIFTSLFLFGITQVLAEKRYVTDRILLGIHVGADEKTNVIKSVPSGTELEVLDTEEGFIEIRLEDGTQGWVSSGFVMTEIPAKRKYDVLANQYEKATQELDKLKIDYAKKHRELQTRRDQLSNAKTTIQDLKKRKGGEVVVDLELENKLATSLEEVKALKLKIIEIEKKSKPKVDIDQKKIFNELKDVKIQNDTMQKRIDIALAHLNGERIPTAEELASIRPDVPLWYWTLLIVLLLVGIVAGYFIMDYRYRSRHGGFRI